MATSTSVGINGDRVELLFGARFDVRYGKDDRVIRDALLDRRATNGDLIFTLEGAGPSSEVRVRPSSIDSIVGSGVDHSHDEDPIGIPIEEDIAELRAELADQAETDALVESFASEGDADPDSVAEKVHSAKAERAANVAQRRDGETAADLLARLERALGASYSRWIETGYGQEILAEAARNAKAGQKPVRKLELDERLTREIDAALDPALPAAILAGAIEKAPKLTKAGRAKLVAAGAGPEAVAAATSAEDVPGVVVRTGKAYADRNQVWKCGTCKKRTRRPECVGTTDAPHPAVSAPAGKRLADRLGDR